MATTEQAQAFIASSGEYLTAVGDRQDQWTVVSREYAWFKHSRVYFTVVVADPGGELWQYTVTESTQDGTEVDGEPVPVQAVTETKTCVTFRPRLVPRTTAP